MWGALEDTRRYADQDYKDHIEASQQEFHYHRILGLCVVITTTIVGTSVFGALTQTTPNFYVQLGTGLLSIIAAVLAAVQAFYSFEERSRAHMNSAMEFFAVKREIDLFFERHASYPADPREIEAINKEQRVIQERYAGAKSAAPIIPYMALRTTAPERLRQRLSQRSRP